MNREQLIVELTKLNPNENRQDVEQSTYWVAERCEICQKWRHTLR